MLILLIFLRNVSGDCSFNTFDESILSKSNPFYKSTFEVDPTSIYGFAFWTKYITYNDVTKTNTVGNLYDNASTLNGYLLMSIYDAQVDEYIVISYLKSIGTVDQSYTVHTLLYIKKNGTQGIINLSLYTLTYEGNWILNVVSMNHQSGSIEYLAQGPSQTIGYINSYINIYNSKRIQVTLGGQGKIKLINQYYNLDAFKGYFSKLIILNQFFYSPSNLNNYVIASNCKIKNECSGLITHTVIDQVVSYDGTQDLHPSYFQTGTNYVIQLWVKLNITQIYYNSYQFVFRARTNKEFQDYTNLGDRSFLLQYFLDVQRNISTFLFVAGYQYNSPQLSTDSKIFGTATSEQYFSDQDLIVKIQQWHFVVYCQEVLSSKQMFFVFYPLWGYYNWVNLQHSNTYRQFSNTLVYFDIGVDRFHNQQKFSGQIANFQFLNCVPSDYDYYPSKSTLNLECHPICESCWGPTKNDCKKCYESQNRRYILDQQTCECLDNYIEIGQDDYQCINEYSLIQFNEFELKRTIQIQKCDFQSNLENHLSCLECFQNYNWLNDSICKTDLERSSVLNNYSPFYNKKRKEKFYELFVRDSQNQLILCVGCLQQCKQGQENCFWHNPLKIWVQCKSNYFYQNQECKQCPNNCLKCDQSGNCLECDPQYYFYSEFNECFQCPIYCKGCSLSHELNDVICTGCFEEQSLFNGKCYRCGQYCGICRYDAITAEDGSEYKINRCLKCSDPSKYYLTFDAVNCQINQIVNCLYAFQYYKPDRSITTMDYLFVPRPLDSNIGTACAKCAFRNLYILSEEQNECIRINTVCQFQFQDPQYNNQIFTIIGESIHAECQNPIERVGSCNFYGYPMISCRGCIYSFTDKLIKCSSCIYQYYAERINGVCVICSIPNCLSCVQQMKTTKDAYVWEMRAFYEHFANKNSKHQYEKYAQSQDPDDYEVICLQCQPGYILVNEFCVKQCPDNCYECEVIDGQAICLRCFETQQGQALTLYNGECIQCPFNCALCIVRDQQIINDINPYFNSQQYIQFSHMCLQPFDSLESLSYDSYTGQFIKCSEYEQCGKQWTIERNLYCSQNQFNLAQIGLDQNQLKKFKQRNALLSQLFSNISGTHIPEIENDIVYLQANRQQISRLVLRYIILGDRECNLQGQVEYGQYFGQHVFTLTNVSLEVLASQKITLTFTESITFVNFTSVTINNISFQQLMNPSQIIFDNLQKTQIQINNCSFISNYQFQIKFNNVTYLQFINNSIINSQIRKFEFSSIFYFISHDSFAIEDVDLILFRNLLISDTQFFNLQFFDYNTQIPCLFENITIYDSQFNNFSFINLSKVKFQLNTLIMQNCQVKDSKSLFIFNYQDKIQIKDLSFSWLNLTNSTFIYSTTNIIITSGRFTNNSLKESKFLFIENENSQQLNIELANFLFQNIQFIQISHIIEIQDFYHINESQVQFSNITFDNNFRANQDYEMPDLKNAVFLINISSIQMIDVIIYRAFGITEFIYLDTNSISIQSFTAQLIDSLEVKGLHQHLDCIQKQLDLESVKPLIQLIEPIKLNFSNFNLQKLIVIDQPLITISSSKPSMGTISLTKWNATNNLLLTTPSSSNVAIFNVKSNFQIEITLQSIIFSENILNQYVIEQASTSSASLSLQCSSCTCSISDMKLISNLVTNSSNAIVYLQLKSLLIQNSYFHSNNLLTYKLIKRHIYFGFPSQFQLTYEIISQLFPITSSGIIRLTSEYIQLKTVKFQNNFGVKGGSILLTTSNKGQVKIYDSHFANISMGGNIYIDNAQSELNLTIDNCIFEQIINTEQGSIVTVNPSLYKVLINIMNSQIIGCESLQGNIISIRQSQYNKYSFVTLNNLTISNTQESFKNFLGYFSDFALLDVNNIISQRYQILVEDIAIYFHNVNFNGLYFSKVFSSRNSFVSMKEILINNFQHAFNLISISYDTYFQSMYLANIKILNNLEYKRVNSTSDCITTGESHQQIQMICQINQIQEQNLQKTNSEKINQCRLNTLLNIIISDKSLFSIDLQQNATDQLLSKIEIENILFFNNTCSSCLNGLLNFYFINNLYNTRFNELTFYQNNCGNGGCFSLQFDENSYSQLRRLNKLMNAFTQSLNLKIKNSKFVNNTIQQGGCIIINNLQFEMENTIILNNIGKTGVSGIQILGQKPYLLLNNQLENDQWDIKLEQDSFNSQQLSLNTISQTSSTSIIPQVPYQLQIKLKKQSPLFLSNRIYYDDKLTIDELNYKQIKQNQQNQYIQFPSGIKISQYVQFNLNSNDSIESNISLTLVPTNQFHQAMNLSSNATCVIKSRKIDISESKNLDAEFLDENYINLKEVSYSQEQNGFNLDNLILFFDPDTIATQVLQLQFYCDSIKTDLFGVGNQYYPLSYQKNYYFRINVRTIPCQLGEIKNQTTHSCQNCDYQQGFYSIQYKATQCMIQNTDYITNITSNNIQIKKGYWRAKYTNPQIDLCKNLQNNCLGGWQYGDDSCYIGHIGALCEECDIYNIRGQGQYSTDNKYSCGPCQSSSNNIIIFIVISIWTLIQVTITVKATYDFTQQLISRRLMVRLALILANENCQAGVLMKFLSTYFQIIGSLSTFQLNIPLQLTTFLQTTGNPINKMIYTLDCVIVNTTSLEIVYTKVIWELLMPIFYMVIFFVFALFIFIYTKKLQRNGLIITGIVYLFLFFQPNLIGSFISVISYRYVDGIKWVQGNLSYRYDTSTHYWWVYILICFTGFFGMIIPSLILYHFYHNRYELNSLRFRKLYGYLYNEFMDSVYFWEIIKLFLKDTIIVILIFYQDAIFMKAILIYLALQGYLLMIYQYRPYRIGYLNDLELQLVFVCQISIIVGFGLYMLDQQQITQPQMSFLIIICFINLYLLSQLLLKLINAYSDKLQIHLDRFKDIIKHKFPRFFNQNPSLNKLFKNKTKARISARKNFVKLFRKLQTSGTITKIQQFEIQNSERIEPLSSAKSQQPRFLLTEPKHANMEL